MMIFGSAKHKGKLEPVLDSEFEALLHDQSKSIEGDIAWSEDEDHSPSVEFSAPVENAAGYPLYVKASYNGSALTLTMALINPAAGRIYALDLGKDHHNPQCDYVGRRHKHQWTEKYRDKQAYAPEDITADVSNPVVVWEQFCTEANICHRGRLSAPPARQLEMF